MSSELAESSSSSTTKPNLNPGIYPDIDVDPSLGLNSSEQLQLPALSRIPADGSGSSVRSASASIVGGGVLEDDWGLTPDLKQLLECPACGNVATPPIFLCQKGHMVCDLCRRRGNVSKCPMCDSDYTTIRNDLAESILGKCTFRCPFAEEGCFRTLKGSEVSQHFEECDFRPVLCAISSESGKPCGRLIGYSTHVHHMRNDHGVEGVEGASAVIGMSTTVKLGQGNWTFPAHFMNAFGHTFWCNIHASFNLLIAWVSLSGTSREIDRFAAAVTIFDPNKKWQQAKWIGQVHSIRATAKEVYDSGNCLSLLPESFLLLSTVDLGEDGRKIKRWRSHFEIIEIAEAVKSEKVEAGLEDLNNNPSTTEPEAVQDAKVEDQSKNLDGWVKIPEPEPEVEGETSEEPVDIEDDIVVKPAAKAEPEPEVAKPEPEVSLEDANNETSLPT